MSPPGVLHRAVEGWIGKAVKEYAELECHREVISYESEYLRDIPWALETYTPLTESGNQAKRLPQEKRADGALLLDHNKYPDLYAPLVFEVGVSQTLQSLREDARQWLLGSGGGIRAVLLVDVNEKSVKAAPMEFSSLEARDNAAQLIHTSSYVGPITVNGELWSMVGGIPAIVASSVSLRFPICEVAREANRVRRSCTQSIRL